MTTNLTWVEVNNLHYPQYKAKTLWQAGFTLADGTAAVFEVIKSNGSRARLLLNGEKEGADDEGEGRVQAAKMRAEALAAEMDRPQAVEAPALPATDMDGGAFPMPAPTPEDVAAYEDDMRNGRDRVGDEPEVFPLPGTEVEADEPDTVPEPTELAPPVPAEAVFDLTADDGGLKEHERAEGEVSPAEQAAYYDRLEAAAPQYLNPPSMAEVDPAAEEWEKVLDRHEAKRMEVLNAGVVTEVVEVTPAPDAETPPPVKVTTATADGWTRKTKVGTPTESACGRAKVLEVYPTSTKHWHAWVDGVQVAGADGNPTVFKSMKAAKAHCDAALTQVPATA